MGFLFLGVANTGLTRFSKVSQSSPLWIIMQCSLLHDQHDNIPHINIFWILQIILEIGQIHVEMNELLESLIKNQMETSDGNQELRTTFNFCKCSDIDLFNGVAADRPNTLKKGFYCCLQDEYHNMVNLLSMFY